MKSKLSLLHLSDLHFKDINSRINKRLQNIALALKSFTMNPDIVLITGDLIKAGNSVNINQLKKPLVKFANTLELNSINFLFVPGNHDVKWDKEHIQERFKAFFSFVNKFRKNSPISNKLDWNNENFKSFVDSTDDIKTDGVYELIKDNVSISLFLLNSVRYFRKKQKLISVDKKVIERIKNMSTDLRKRLSLNIALTHNPPLNVRPATAKSNKAKVIKNSDDLFDCLSAAGVGMILHGDGHETQHIAVARTLKSDDWPLYTVGAGRISADGDGTPRFHLINISISDDADNCSEVEIITFEITAEDHILPMTESCYVFYLPICGNIKDSKGTIHVFELPQSRLSCDNILVKNMLFRYRINALDLVYQSTKDLIADKKKTSIMPDHMFSFFYDSIFKIFKPDSDMFKAVHHGNYMVWTQDSSCKQILNAHMEKHQCKKGCVERVIILTDKEYKKLQKYKVCQEEFKEFLSEMIKFQFPIYITYQKWINDIYFKAMSAQLVGRESNSKDLENNIMLGNIALFYRENKFSNAIAFYFTENPDNKIVKAYVTREERGINFINECLKTLWGLTNEKHKVNDKDIPLMFKCHELLNEKNLNLFLGR